MDNCKKCFMPGNYPGISIDGTGLCNLCRKAKFTSPEVTSKLRASLEKELFEAANHLRKKKYKYHCAVALSGGKDSLTLLFMLKAIIGHGTPNIELVGLHVNGAVSCGATNTSIVFEEVPLVVK